MDNYFNEDLLKENVKEKIKLIYKDIISTYIGDSTFIISIITGIILMIGIYICYFGGTYYTFKRNVN